MYINLVLEENEEDYLDRSCENGVLHRVKEERNILHSVKRRKANWIGCAGIAFENTLLKER
jgi:hypothetical protein